MHKSTGKIESMVAAPPRKPGAPRKAIRADVNITFAVESAVRDALDRLPRPEKRGFIRRVLKKALQKRGLLDRAEPAK